MTVVDLTAKYLSQTFKNETIHEIDSKVTLTKSLSQNFKNETTHGVDSTEKFLKSFQCLTCGLLTFFTLL